MIKKIILALVLLVVVAALGFFAPGILKGDLENETRVMVEKPKDHVWAKFQDESKMGEWLEGFKSIETFEGEPGTVGSKHRLKFENDGREIEMVETVTANEAGKRFAFNLENEVMYSDIEVTLVDKGLSTEVIQKEKFHGQNVFWHSLFYWLKSSLAENSKKNMDNFKKYAEGA